MNILFFGSEDLLTRVKRQTEGQSWDIHRVRDPDDCLDYTDTHSFQAALVGMCSEQRAIRAVTQNAKSALKMPVVIGLASQDQALSFDGLRQGDPDILIPECGNDRLTKIQCDAILRYANSIPSQNIRCGDVSFDTAQDTFSVHGQAIQLPAMRHKLLELLFLKQGRTVTKEMVFNHLYGWDEPPETKIVDVFFCQIRRTLSEAGLAEECIQTVWGRGYTVPLDAEPSQSCAA